MSSTESRSITEGVPSPGNPDRKRVLNVLAQRRYRKRRRERVAALEARAQASPSTSYPLQNTFPTPVVTPIDSEPIRNVSNDTPELDSILQTEADSLVELPNSDMGAASSSNFTASFDQTIFDIPMPTFTDLDLSFPPSTLASTKPSYLDHASAPTFDFPLTPDQNIEVPVLGTLRATLTIASLLSVQNSLFDISCMHTLAPSPQLPPNLQPTEAQRSIPHHPILDILPWPTVRTKLIYMLTSGASQLSGGLAIMQLVADMDDLAEGMRVSGTNELDEASWEVGEAMLKNWWWAFDARIIGHSNQLRAMRGAPRLRIGA
ncbi:uncharacterized protein BDZ99DRAFT_527621 [Mytilinidion resinicola]|uniref:BZIP domain-containing protein n=1 Tax=Mytilinidion resinicola TaxID=574789 RepID=A0A6A6Y0S9_9PEZI|nr:uncharacterized protein BDZ99DRAFT_527621 [Mytilinidion resinicola]KAF2802250.1 hypothetical protein BDZ99DRAFT_527621 [Mytilinidion resinicola]